MMRHPHIGDPKRVCPGCFDELEEMVAEKHREKIVRILTLLAIIAVTAILIILAIAGNAG